MSLFRKCTAMLFCLIIATSFVACTFTENESSSGSDLSSQTGTSSSKPAGQMVQDSSDGEKIWTGMVAVEVGNGDGTKENPYLIFSAEELAYAVTEDFDEEVYYQLQNDIYLNDVTNKNWMNNSGNKQWVSSGKFSGHIDGNGFCIYGIWFDSKNQPAMAGFIEMFESGSIQNLGIRNSFIVAKKYAGAFISQACSDGYKLIENCFVDETVYVQYTDDSNNGAGGIIGYAYDGDVKYSTLDILNCYSKAQVLGHNASERVNGIIGTAWKCNYTMKNCYSIGCAPYYGGTKDTASALLNSLKTSDVYSNIYTNSRTAQGSEKFTKLSSSKMQGDQAKSNMKFNFQNVFETVDGACPKLQIFTGVNGKNLSVTDISKLDCLTREFEQGKGTKAEPFVITTADELKKVVSSGWNNTYFVLGSDIYVNNTNKSNWASSARNWVAGAKAFSGYFDGKGYSVYGLYYNATPATDSISSAQKLGLFSAVSPDAVIRNVHIRNSYLTGKSYVGGIAGYVTGNSSSDKSAVITGCSVDETVILAGQTVGGILGGGGGGVEITYCYFTGAISEATGSTASISRGNGIVGDIWSSNYKLAECYTVGYQIYRDNFQPKHMSALYSDIQQTGVVCLAEEKMSGSAAKNNMRGLNWQKVWKTTSGYPEQKVLPEDFKYTF